MAKFKLSIKPLKEALERTHPNSGAKFTIAPLAGERDQELTRECSDMYGNVNAVLFARLVAKECIKGWSGVGEGDVETVCNETTVDEFARNHCSTIMPWIIREARSIEHYREQELDAAKKD